MGKNNTYLKPPPRFFVILNDALSVWRVPCRIFCGRIFWSSTSPRLPWAAILIVKNKNVDSEIPAKNIRKHHSYCWWLKSCTTWDVWNPVNNGIFTISTGAGFQPSTVILSICSKSWLAGWEDLASEVPAPVGVFVGPWHLPWICSLTYERFLCFLLADQPTGRKTQQQQQQQEIIGPFFWRLSPLDSFLWEEFDEQDRCSWRLFKIRDYWMILDSSSLWHISLAIKNSWHSK